MAAGEVIQGNPLPFCYAENGGRCNLASRANMDVCNLASNVCMDVSTQTVLLGSTLKPGSAPGRGCRLAAKWQTGKERAMRKWKIGGTAGGIFDRPFKGERRLN